MKQSTAVVINKRLYEIHHPTGDAFKYRVVSQKLDLGWIFIVQKDNNSYHIWSGSNTQLIELANGLGYVIDFYNDVS